MIRARARGLRGSAPIELMAVIAIIAPPLPAVQAAPGARYTNNLEPMALAAMDYGPSHGGP